MKNRRLIVLIAPVALVLGLIQAPAAFASPDDVVQAANRMDTAIGRANPDVSQEVVDGLPISIQNRSDIWVDPSVPADTIWLTTDGEVFEDQAADKVQRSVQCRWNAVAPAYSSGLRYNSPCGYIGTDGGATITYTRTTDPNSSGTSCWNARHYAWRFDNTWQERWTGAGCYDRSITLSWGPVASTPAAIISNPSYIGWAGAFVA